MTKVAVKKKAVVKPITKKEFLAYLRHIGACEPSMRWLARRSLSEAYRTCSCGEWLMELAYQVPTLEKTIDRIWDWWFAHWVATQLDFANRFRKTIPYERLQREVGKEIRRLQKEGVI